MAGDLRPAAFRMRFTMPKVEGSFFVRDGASLRWSKAGLCWSMIGLLVGVLVYPFDAVNVDVTIIAKDKI